MCIKFRRFIPFTKYVFEIFLCESIHWNLSAKWGKIKLHASFKVAYVFTSLSRKTSKYLLCLAPGKTQSLCILFCLYLIYFCIMVSDSEEILLFSKCGHGFCSRKCFAPSCQLLCDPKTPPVAGFHPLWKIVSNPTLSLSSVVVNASTHSLKTGSYQVITTMGNCKNFPRFKKKS